MDNFSTLGIDAEDVHSLAEFFRLKYNGLKSLRDERVSVYKALGHPKYLHVALSIDNRKVSFSLWILVKKCHNGFNSLNTGMISIQQFQGV